MNGRLPDDSSRGGLLRRRFATFSVVLLFIAISLAFQIILLLSPQPRVLVATDPGNVATFIAGWMYPERFAADPVLSERQHYAFYVTILIPLTIATNLVVNDLGTAYSLMQFPLVFFQLVGFWRLGVFLFEREMPAVLLALLSLPPVYVLGYGELWGVYDEPLTRMTYCAALPFLLLAFVSHAAKPLAPLWLFILCGLSVYLYPVSAPTVALALWIGCFALRASSRPRELWIMIAAGIIFVLVALPYALIFYSKFPSLDSASDSASVSALKVFSGGQYTNAWLAQKLTIFGPTGQGWGWRWLVWAIGLGGFLLVPIVHPEKKRLCIFFGLFLFGIWIGSIGISWLDQQVAARLGRTPAQMDLVRNMRFLVPILLIGAVWFIVVFVKQASRWSGTRGQIPIAALLILLVASWWNTNEPSLLKTGQRLLNGQSVGPSQRKIDESAVLQYLKNAEPDSRVLLFGEMSLGLAIRYGSLQPTVYNQKDFNVFLYSTSDDRLREWTDHQERMKELRAAKTEPDAAIVLRAIMISARARYLVLDRDDFPAAGRAAVLSAGQIVFETKHFAILDARRHFAEP